MGGLPYSAHFPLKGNPTIRSFHLGGRASGATLSIWVCLFLRAFFFFSEAGGGVEGKPPFGRVFCDWGGGLKGTHHLGGPPKSLTYLQKATCGIHFFALAVWA